MSYFDDQEDAWFANDCKGRIEDYDPYDGDSWPQEEKPRKQRAGGGRDRALLVLAKIEEFAAWAVSQGYRRETPKGTYEILRLRIQGQSPVLYFRKSATAGGGQPVHATCYGEGTKLVQRWLRERNNKRGHDMPELEGRIDQM